MGKRGHSEADFAGIARSGVLNTVVELCRSQPGGRTAEALSLAA